MRQGVVISDIKVDLRASLMKPLHANWLMCAISTLSDKCDAIKKHLKLSESLTIYSTVDHKHKVISVFSCYCCTEL